MKFSIFSRLVIGYLALFLPISVMSAFSFFQLEELNRISSSIMQADKTIIDLTSELREVVSSETDYEKNFIVTQEKAFLNSIMQSQGIFRKHLGDTITVSDKVKSEELLLRVSNLQKTFDLLFNEQIRQYNEYRAVHRKLYEKQRESFVSKINDDLTSLIHSSEENIFNKIKVVSATLERGSQAGLGIMAVSLLLGSIILFFITRTISIPLSEMNARTREIAAGNFEGKLTITSPPEIAELATSFNMMCDRLKELDAMKADFCSMMSHELRTPLTSIKEATNLMLDGIGGTPTDKHKRLLTIITEESRRMIELVNSLLDLSKMKAGMLEFNFVDTDIASLVSMVRNEIEPLVESKQLDVQTEIDDLPKIRVDVERILQVLRNLIGNAIKFTPVGGNVRISGKKTHDAVRISVTDNGPGIPKEHLDRIFVKYQQIMETTSLKGTGLGLAIAKNIVMAHKGKIWVESGNGKGCTFHIELPC